MATSADFFGTPVIQNSELTDANVVTNYAQALSGGPWLPILTTSAVTKLKRITIAITAGVAYLPSTDAFLLLGINAGGASPVPFDSLPFGGLQGNLLTYVFDDSLYARGYRGARPGKILSSGVSLVAGQLGYSFVAGSTGNVAWIHMLGATP